MKTIDSNHVPLPFGLLYRRLSPYEASTLPKAPTPSTKRPRRRPRKRSIIQDPPPYADRLAQAIDRELDHRFEEYPPIEYSCLTSEIFKCVCCSRLLHNSRRREYDSEVCTLCEQAAGFNYD